MGYLKSNLIACDKYIYLNVDSLIDINNIITGLNNVTLIKVNVKPCGYGKMYMEKDLTEVKLYQLIDQFNKIKINQKYFHSTLLNNILENGRTCKILFVSK